MNKVIVFICITIRSSSESYFTVGIRLDHDSIRQLLCTPLEKIHDAISAIESEHEVNCTSHIDTSARRLFNNKSNQPYLSLHIDNFCAQSLTAIKREISFHNMHRKTSDELIKLSHKHGITVVETVDLRMYST